VEEPDGNLPRQDFQDIDLVLHMQRGCLHSAPHNIQLVIGA
jgi:hypothetical protein